MSALCCSVRRRSASLSFVFAVFLFSFLESQPAVAGDVTNPPARLDFIQKTVENFQGQLGITQRIDVIVVAKESRLVTIRPRENGRFLLTFDEAFLAQLSEEEIKAAMAHEFGHLWIFTHHPYLQTEQLANRKALELVSAASLQKVYDKVVHCGGVGQALPGGIPEKAEEGAAEARGGHASN